MVDVVEDAAYEARGGKEQAAVARWEALTALAEGARAARLRSEEGLRALDERVEAAAGRRLGAARAGRDALEEGAWGLAAEARRLGEGAEADARRADAIEGLTRQAAGRGGALARARRATLSRAAWAAEAEVSRVWAQVTLGRRAVDAQARLELQALKGAAERVFCPGHDHAQGLSSLRSALAAWEARHAEALDRTSGPLLIELALQAALLDGAINTQLREADADRAALIAGLQSALRALQPAPAPPIAQAFESSSDQRAQTSSSSWLKAAWRLWSACTSALGSR